MPLPTVTTLPTPPSAADASNFSQRADTFLGALPTYQGELNALAAALAALFHPPGVRNAIINGDFLEWLRGSSQTTNGYGSDDRWHNTHVGSSKTHSRQLFTPGQTAVAGEPVAFSRTVVTSVANASNFVAKQQRIESVRRFAGQTVVLSFSAKADASRQLAVDFLQRFGTGGSPSADVAGIGAQKFSLTTSWQRFSAAIAIPSIAGKTLGTAADCLELTFWFDAGSSFNARTASLGQQSGTFDIADVQVELGTVATNFERLPPAIVRSLCNRYARQLYVTAVASGFVQDYSFEQMLAAPTVSVVSSAWTGTPTFTATAANSLRQGTYASGAGAGTLLLTSEL
jgi:hypothetical protein